MNFQNDRRSERQKRSFWFHFLRFLLGLGTIFILSMIYRSDINKILQKNFNRNQPCKQAISYTIWDIDPRFGISEKKLLSNIAKAENIWESSIDKNLFEYAATGKVKISLIYDYRQEATIALKKLGITIKYDKATYDTLKSKYTTLNIQYFKEKTYLDALIQEYIINKNAYEKDVAYWNSKGGAPQEEYNALEQRRIALNTQGAMVNQTQNSLNRSIETLNSVIVILNTLVTSLNIQAEKYNEIGGPITKTFNEGEYTQNGNSTVINVFQFNNEDELIRVLAHELGHALGLEHSENPKAIMYYLNEGMNKKTAADDIVALKKQCKIE